MAQFSFPKLAWSETIFDRLLSAIKKADEEADYDSGWVARPSGNLFTHDLGVVPKEVHAHESANSDGSSFTGVAYSAVNTRTLTVAGSAAYCRVRVNK